VERFEQMKLLLAARIAGMSVQTPVGVA